MKKERIFYLVTISVLAFLFVYTAFSYGMLMIRVAMAREQVMIFEYSRDEGIKKEPAECISHLQYIINYYPSGSNKLMDIVSIRSSKQQGQEPPGSYFIFAREDRKRFWRRSSSVAGCNKPSRIAAAYKHDITADKLNRLQ
jgi:hypothetical protein